MNFLNNPGLQNNINNIVVTKSNKDLSFSIDNKTIEDKQNNFHYLVIGCLFLFFIFIFYVINSNANKFINYKSLSISTLFQDLSSYDNLTIKSMENSRNKLATILSCDTEGYLFENVYAMKDKYSNIKIKTNNKFHEIWIEELSSSKYISNFDDILRLIKSDNNHNLETEIINNNLIIVGTIEEIKSLFLLFEKNNLTNIEFKLNLIKYEYNKNFYKLIL
tara:strand:+ start:462 stop:1121 length:660 start_codon:yes stop_codon:yes gene_type:complete